LWTTLYVFNVFLNFTFLFFLLVGACKSYFVASVLLSLRSVYDVNKQFVALSRYTSVCNAADIVDELAMRWWAWLTWPVTEVLATLFNVWRRVLEVVLDRRAARVSLSW